MKNKKIITIAIDSPAAAGAGTQAKLIAKNYNLFHLDTGKIYRYIGYLRLKQREKFTHKFIQKKINVLKLKNLKDKKLLTDETATSASIIAKDLKIRKIVHKFQQKCAYHPPKTYRGSVLDGRDIITIQVKDAMFKFFSVKIRAKRRYEEYKKLKKKISYSDVLKSLKNRDKSDRERKHGPLIKTKDSILINTSKLSKKACFLKIKKIIDKKLKINGNI